MGILKTTRNWKTFFYKFYELRDLFRSL